MWNMFKVNNQTPEGGCSDVFIVNFKHNSDLFYPVSIVDFEQVDVNWLVALLDLDSLLPKHNTSCRCYCLYFPCRKCSRFSSYIWWLLPGYYHLRNFIIISKAYPVFSITFLICSFIPISNDLKHCVKQNKTLTYFFNYLFRSFYKKVFRDLLVIACKFLKLHFRNFR